MQMNPSPFPVDELVADVNRLNRAFEDVVIVYRNLQATETERGPVLLEGKYQKTTFEQWTREGKIKWKVSYDFDTEEVTLYGDPSELHEVMASNVREEIMEGLRKGIAEGLLTGIPQWDNLSDFQKVRELVIAVSKDLEFASPVRLKLHVRT